MPVSKEQSQKQLNDKELATHTEDAEYEKLKMHIFTGVIWAATKTTFIDFPPLFSPLPTLRLKFR